MEKLCPHCKKWSDWTGHLNDKCTYCNEFLKLEERIDLAVKEEKRKKLEFNFKQSFPFSVKQGDNILLKLIKHTAYGIYFIFMSIMVTILWIVFWVVT